MRIAAFFILLVLISAPSLASPPSLPSEPPHRDLFTLELKKDRPRKATFVEPRADGTVSYLEPDGSVGYVPMVRVVRITDEAGTDVTERALRRREWLGTPPPRPVPFFFAPKPSVWKHLKLGPQPKEACASFVITDATFTWVVRDSRFAEDDEQQYMGVDYGYGVNTSSKSAIGGSAFLTADGARSHAGLRLRIYRWISREASIDLSPGIILLGNEEGQSRFLFPGYSGQVGLSWLGKVGVVGQIVSVRRRWTWVDASDTETETSAYLGLRFGAEGGIMASAALAVAGMNALTSRRFNPTF